MPLEITKYQAWRFSTSPHPEYNKRGKGEFEQLEPRYSLGPARDTFEEALADLIRCHEGFRNDGSLPVPHRDRFDVVVPDPERQFGTGDLARQW